MSIDEKTIAEETLSATQRHGLASSLTRWMIIPTGNYEVKEDLRVYDRQSEQVLDTISIEIKGRLAYVTNSKGTHILGYDGGQNQWNHTGSKPK